MRGSAYILKRVVADDVLKLSESGGGGRSWN